MTLDDEIVPEEIEGRAYEGEYAVALLPAGYKGACAMRFYDKHGGYWVKFPTCEEAFTAASGACRWDVGGYTSVSLHPASAAPINAPLYPSALHWLFEGQGVLLDEERPEEVGTVAIVRRAMKELAREIAQRPTELVGIEWRDLERLLGVVFERLGFSTTVTRASKDGAYDLRLEADGDVYLVEVKHWSEPSKVGTNAIDHFAELAVAKQAKGMLILLIPGEAARYSGMMAPPCSD